MAQTPTPSSEIIHLTTAFTDALDSLPPSLTRSLSDLKELDAVLNSSLQSITDKLKLLHSMMHTPEPGKKLPEGEQPQYTPLDRLKLLREVAEDARVFRLGGEDKIRVATNTCETLSTHTSHLSTLSTLLLGFLPSHLLPHLPAPSAPHGYPQSNTSLRGRYDYAAARHPGQGSTTRLSGALGMVREHYDLTRSGAAGGRAAGGAGGGGAGKKRAAQIDYSIYGDDSGMGSSRRAGGMGGAGGEKDPSQRHPNQYTKKRLAGVAGASPGGAMHGGGAVSAAQTNAAAGVYSVPHQYGQQYASSAAEKDRRRELTGSTVGGGGAPPMNAGGNGSRAGGAGQQQQQYAYAAQEEFAMAMQQQRQWAKRKQVEDVGGNKRRKKGIADSPDPSTRTLPGASTAAHSRAPRRQNSSSTRPEDDPSLQYTSAAAQQQLPAGAEEFDPALEGLEGDDEQDKTLYCFCQRVSFGEMIACDAPDCEHEWFHLPCVGLKSIPDGRWFCDECRRTVKAGKKGRR
ncbi:hypothetical protein JCM8547_007253 [Rhodosporidiobolus lusitaniae]